MMIITPVVERVQTHLSHAQISTHYYAWGDTNTTA